MNTRRLPTRAAAERKAVNINAAEEGGGAALNVDREHPAIDSAPPAKRQRCVNEKNEVDITGADFNCVKQSSAAHVSAQTPKGGVDANSKETVFPRVQKDDDDQTATTCNETPATEEKNGQTTKTTVSQADFHPLNPSGGGKPPGRSKNTPPPENSSFSYPSFPYYGQPGNVPPLAHIPFPVSQISPLQVQDSSRNGKKGLKDPKRNDPPVTPHRTSVKESEAALAMLGCASEGSAANNAKSSSPLELLSNVSSTSPSTKAKKAALDATMPPLQAGVAAPPFKYPPPDQMDVNNFHCFPQVPQSGIKFGHGDDYSLPPISDTFDPVDDFNPDTPSSRNFSIGDVLNAANVVERKEATVKTTRKMYDLHLGGAQSPLRRKAPPTEGTDPGNASYAHPSLSFGKTSTSDLASSIKNVHSIAPEVADAAEKACILAQQALENPYIGKQLLLSMAIVRTNPRSPPSSYPAHGTLLTDRFHWAQFPPLDTILRKNMKKYYELSTKKCQSKDQQDFNNLLVEQVKSEALKYGWEFDRTAFDDKKIRDRIRCFFKTHIQNAKKRLKTMLKNPSKKANIKALANHFHLIEEKHKIEPPVKWKNKDDEYDGFNDDGREEFDVPDSNHDVNANFLGESSDKAPVAAYSEV